MAQKGAIANADSVDIPAKVAFLADPGSYPGAVTAVEVIQTHMSWVFLTDRHAYKFKKPIRLSYLDFSTLERRRHNCLNEVRLNRRLAPDVYLGVLPLVRTPGGKLAVGVVGETVEWLVHMRRLPYERMLDTALAAGAVSAGDIREVARVLGRFYRQAERVPVAPDEWCRRLARRIQENGDQLGLSVFGMDRTRVGATRERLLGFLKLYGDQLTARVMAGRIVEGHGDLRPEHVCLETPPVFIDCLEFNRDFRIVDPAEEIGYLAMECELLDAPFVGRVAFERYGEVTGDRPDPRLVTFYKSSRALLRAKLCAWHLLDHEPAEDAEWVRRAAAYLELAASYADSF